MRAEAKAIASEKPRFNIKRPRSRSLMHLGAYLHPDFKKGILMLRVATGEDFQTLLARMLNEQFQLHGLPIITNAD